jgi:hypothetical protein
MSIGILYITCLGLCLPFILNAQDSTATITYGKSGLIKGYHVGVVQPIVNIRNGVVESVFEYDRYTIGFPIGISLKTPGSLIIDLEVVPFVSPLLDERADFGVHLLYHPGVLMPLGKGFTFGMRLAFETGQGQFGFTPLINKSFRLGPGSIYFIEIVAPGRFGPNEKSGYSQVIGFHTGVAF